MSQSDHLFFLVRSLSKSEKRYFRLQAQLQEGEKVFTALFDSLDQSHSAAEARAAVQRKFPEAAFGPACKHLYKILMRSLRAYEAERSTDSRLLNLIADVRILFNRGCIELCFAEIERGKQLALKHEKFFYFLILARFELQYLTTLEFPGCDEASLVARQEKINDMLYFELFINKHSSLFEILSHRYLHEGVLRSEAGLARLNDLVLEEFQVNANPHYNSFQSEKLHFHFQSTYFMMAGEPEQSLQEFYQLHKLFEENTFRWHDEPVYYIYVLHGIITSLRRMQKYDDMRFFIESLRAIQVEGQGLGVLVRHLIAQYELAVAIDKGLFDEGLACIRDFETQGASVENATPNVYAFTQWYMGLVYFGVNDFSKALHHINKALDGGEAYISQQVYGLCRLLSLIIHLELGNDDHLVYSIRSFERKLKTRKKLFGVEKVTLDFLRQWIKRTPGDSKVILGAYRDGLHNLKDDKFENQLLAEFNVAAWADAKIKKISLPQVMAMQP